MPHPKQKPRAATPAAVKSKSRQLPEWLGTPEVLYELEMFCDQVQESILLERSEYITLKHHLAKLRGYAVPKENTDAAK